MGTFSNSLVAKIFDKWFKYFFLQILSHDEGLLHASIGGVKQRKKEVDKCGWHITIVLLNLFLFGLLQLFNQILIKINTWEKNTLIYLCLVSQEKNYLGCDMDASNKVIDLGNMKTTYQNINYGKIFLYKDAIVSWHRSILDDNYDRQESS